MNKLQRHSKRVFIGVVGGAVVLIGLVLVPYPGPGWLIVFSGLAILSTEFAFAARWLERARAEYDKWASWLKKQPRIVQLSALLLTGLVVTATVWLLNGFGIINDIFTLNQDWVVSPLFR